MTDPLTNAHTWLKKVRIAYAPGPTDALTDEFSTKLLDSFRANGHTVLAQPEGAVDVLLTTAPFGKPLTWREAFILTARRRFKLEHAPTVFTIVHITETQLQGLLDHFKQALAKDELDLEDYRFPGLTEQAYRPLYEQGRRGGPILSVLRLLQSQAMCIRILLVVGEDHPQAAYTFDLVGAYPRSEAALGAAFYDDLMLRVLTAVSTHEITNHQVVGEPISQAEWQRLEAPKAMKYGGRQLGARNFFTEMIVISDLVTSPGLNDAISSQYSEGCFATWEPQIDGLITTITGSARPVVKDRLTDDELAVITGVRPDELGAQVRHVDGKRNDSPSSEAVELMQMDKPLPHPTLGSEWGALAGKQVPVARSKLHGHRGVRAYDPRLVEHVFLDKPYYHYPVSCATQAQAVAIQTTFGRSATLLDPSDPRQIAFTVLPGHGVVIVEKWVPGKVPFQAIWEAMDSGALQIVGPIPQGPLSFVPDSEGKMVLEEQG